MLMFASRTAADPFAAGSGLEAVLGAVALLVCWREARGDKQGAEESQKRAWDDRERLLKKMKDAQEMLKDDEG